jgi:oxygen-independent coproporphyrinogen-3 oxidase
VDLSAEDVLRRETIMAIMCGVPIDFDAFQTRHGVDFEAHFSPELAQLAPHADAGLLQLGGRRLAMPEKGRLFARASAMVFDQYLGQPRTATYSKLI